MKIVFVSNYYNHHQHALSLALDRITGGEYAFVATSEMRRERRELGYGMEKTPGFVKYANREGEQAEQCKKLIAEADVLIAGAAPEKLISKRIRQGKLTFRYTERPFKQGIPAGAYVPQWLRMHIRNPAGKPVYLLCAGAFTASDCEKFGLFRGKAYRWGYFPETIRYPSVEDLMERKDTNTILWAGRFLEWKHPELALETAKRLKEAGYSFTLKMIGTGELDGALRAMAHGYGLEDCVHFLGPMKPEEVRKHMERSNLFLFTSDRLEGWGAVLNEAMNSGCAVVASHDVGSAPYLIEDGKNGLIYPSGDGDGLYERVRNLLDRPEERRELGKQACETICARWNAETAAERLCRLADSLLSGSEPPEYGDAGPCSRAPLLWDDWM